MPGHGSKRRLRGLSVGCGDRAFSRGQNRRGSQSEGSTPKGASKMPGNRVLGVKLGISKAHSEIQEDVVIIRTDCYEKETIREPESVLGNVKYAAEFKKKNFFQ